ncbi:hypothetical protein PInf_014601 [Phytophthora infestans]|nr:hypothetical protein PInf_014601 [Phytophthora infestans]
MKLFHPLIATFALLLSTTSYAEAVAEGGKLVLYHGGDTPTQQEYLHEVFQQRFSEINFTLIVDYSKYHDVHIDDQLETDTLVEKIASSYPNDDDAVLYLYTRYVELYGWDWVAKLANQSVAFHRGSNVAAELVAAGEKAVGMGTDIGGNNPYIAWGQRAAILAKARHPAAAKLFMNWALSEEVQSNTVAPSVRTDINTDKPWDVPEANMAGFPLFMEDRETVEEWKQTFTLQGVGLYPGL